MANILLVDSDALAQRALRGLLGLGDHRLVVAESTGEAWEILRRNVKVDLLIAELRLKGEGSLPLVQRLKADPFLAKLPVVIYTGHPDKDAVRRALGMGVQDFLLKPYRDEAVYVSIAKAVEHGWRKLLMTKPGADLEAERLRAMRLALADALEKVFKSAQAHLGSGDAKALLLEPFQKLSVLADKVGLLQFGSFLRKLASDLEKGDWPTNEASLEPLEFSSRLLRCLLNPDFLAEDFKSDEEIEQERDEAEHQFWVRAARDGNCPMADWDQIKHKIDQLKNCPVPDSVAASYQMAANGRPTSLSPLMDLVQRDPSLTVQILMEANRLKTKKEEGSVNGIEDTRMAIGLLGEVRLSQIGSNLQTVPECRLTLAPHSSWSNFRMFQVGTAMLAKFVAIYLEMPALANAAYTAGLIHDIGKILLIDSYPHAYQAILEHALRFKMKLSSAERFYMGATSLEMAAHFAQNVGLSRRFVNVLRWLDTAEAACDDVELVAIVSLARDLCRHNHLGFCGDTPEDDATPLEETEEWRILRQRVYLNFDLKRFEEQAHRECLRLKREILGQGSARSVA